MHIVLIGIRTPDFCDLMKACWESETSQLRCLMWHKSRLLISYLLACKVSLFCFIVSSPTGPLENALSPAREITETREEGWWGGEIEGWRCGEVEGWRDEGMERWRDEGMSGWRDGRMERWGDGGEIEEWKESRGGFLKNFNRLVYSGFV